MKIYGHRGARGLFPENTLLGFEKTIALGVDGIELDVVISKDKQLVVSHDPWMNPKFCLTPEGKTIKNKTHNLYEMDYKTIQQFDCGSKQNKLYPKQATFKSHKPLLPAVFDLFRKKTTENFIVFLELKSDSNWIDTYQPNYEEYAKMVLLFLANNPIPCNLVIKSFDAELMNTLYKLNPIYNYGFLVENKKGLDYNLNQLIFKPKYYNILHTLINKKLVMELNQLHIKCATWTVNKTAEFERLQKVGVTEFITDYPDLIK